MNIKELLKNGIILLDGGMGTMLQQNGLEAGSKPELLNLTEPKLIQKIHAQYFEAGANIITANTFGANLLQFDAKTLESIIAAAIHNAKTVVGDNGYVALDIGPTGKLLRPYGDLDFEDAVSIFAQTVKDNA